MQVHNKSSGVAEPYKLSNITYNCETCGFLSNKKTNYNAHLLTKKHKQKNPSLITPPLEQNIIINEYKSSPVIPQIHLLSSETDKVCVLADKEYYCETCSRTYNTRTGLWKHRKKCVDTNTRPQQPLSYEDKSSSDNPRTPTFVPNSGVLAETMLGNMVTMIYDLVKQNQEIKDLLLKQQEQLALPAQTIIHNHNHTTMTNHNHAHISFNVFLQEKCKFAMNLNDFVDNLKVRTCDVEMVGRLGFVEGISRIILNGLSKLDVYSRPIHCTDTKRDTIYIREQDEWKRDTQDKRYTKHAISRVANKNLNAISEWKQLHPDTDIFESDAYNMNMLILVQSLGGIGGTSAEKTERNQEKIWKRIMPDVMMDKHANLL
jgi:hypothetical protein